MVYRIDHMNRLTNEQTILFPINSLTGLNSVGFNCIKNQIIDKYIFLQSALVQPFQG